MPTKTASKTTTDHEEIRRWAEDRGAQPACVRGTGARGDIGMLRLDFPGYSGGSSLEHISWDEWFQKFDQNNLALLYQDTTASGEKSNFNKLVDRSTDGPAKRSRQRASSSTRTRSASASKGARSHAGGARGRSTTGSRSRSASHRASAATRSAPKRSSKSASAAASSSRKKTASKAKSRRSR
ncbi:MAG TPA: hypothetical protein VKX49_14900 [Bryobacteraceae bacterium]|nr:hypothetical protein [Bryobacteraceae bacterium]